MDGVANLYLSSSNHSCEQTAQTHRRAFGCIGDIQCVLAIASLKLFTTRVRRIGDFQERLADTQARAGGQVVYMQVQINNQVVASKVHTLGFPGDDFQKPGIHYRNLHQRIGIGLQAPTISRNAMFCAESRSWRRLTLFIWQPKHNELQHAAIFRAGLHMIQNMRDVLHVLSRRFCEAPFRESAAGAYLRFSSLNSLYSTESTSASQLASMMLSCTPTVPHVSLPSVLSMMTRVLAAVPLPLSRMRTL